MNLIQDAGEFIPFSKKELASSCEETAKTPASRTQTTLAQLWPEPNWIDLKSTGVDKHALAYIYSIYFSLAKRPILSGQWSFNNVRVTVSMWESAYKEVVTLVRNTCESAKTVRNIDDFIEAFDRRYTGVQLYVQYAAGIRTSRKLFHSLRGKGPASGYKMLLPYLDFPERVNPKQIPLFPVAFIRKIDNHRFFRLCKERKMSVRWSTTNSEYDNEFATYEEAVSALLNFHGKEFTKESKAQTNHKKKTYLPKKRIDHIPGVPPDYGHKTTEALMNEFGFRGIQFGNYIPQKERQLFIDNTFHSLWLCAQILGVPSKWIGGGRLGLAFGARGHGNSAAHYEIDLHVINLTRFNGPGSIAHELFHSMDARMAAKWTNRPALLSELLARMSDKNVFDYYGDSDYANNLVTFNAIKRACTQQSEYTQNAQSLSSQIGAPKYWDRPSELCARAFEAYIEARIESMGVVGRWLAYGTKEDDFRHNGMHPYPCGDDRSRIFGIFSQYLPLLFSHR